MENMELGSFNPSMPFKAMNNIDLNSVNKLDNFGDVKILNGSVQVQLPENFANMGDKELVNDLNQLVQPISQVDDANALSSADKVAKAFQSALSDGIKSVDTTQKNAEKAIETFATGGNIDVHDVMIAAKKSHLSLSMAMQLRNKMVQAYQEISRIQV